MNFTEFPRVLVIVNKRNLTQQALATKLRATMQWVQQIEYGANLTIHSLARLANALDVELGALLVPPNPSSHVKRAGRPPGTTTTPARRENVLIAAEPPRKPLRRKRPAPKT